MSLTIIIFTINGTEKLAKIVPALLGVADELVIGVDDSSSDGSFHAARTYTDKVVSVPHAVLAAGGGVPLLMQYCTSDWVLRIDHDETLSPHWSGRDYVRGLLANRAVTHMWIPRRWIIPPGNRYLCSFPWQPDYQLRLFRNLPSFLELSPKLHGENVIVGESYFVTDSWINHLDLVWNDRAAREAKVRLYEQHGPSEARFYLYEERAYETKPLEWSPEPPQLSAFEASASPFHASLRFVDVPRDVFAASHATMVLCVRNESSRSFIPGNGWSRDANVRAAYQWHALDSGIATREYPRVPLPKRLEPGASTFLFLVVATPDEPGRYLLRPDLVEEQVAWFSHHCVIEPLEVVVREAPS
jgi:hypothetical protein